MKTCLSIFVLSAALAFSGCASSPVHPVATAATGADMVGTALGTTIAGAAGYTLGGLVDNNSTSKAVGAATGAALYLTNAEVKRNEKAKTAAEAYEEGRRDGRIEAAKEYWDEVTDANGELVRNAQKLKTKGVRQIQYDSRYVNGVNVGAGYEVNPSTGPAPLPNAEDLNQTEPARPSPETAVTTDK